MNAKYPSFFQVFSFLSLFVLLAFLTWISLSFSHSMDADAWLAWAATWGAVFAVAVILRLFSFRQTWFSAIETAWLAWLVLFWLLILLDTSVCGMPGRAFCEPATLSSFFADGARSQWTHSYLIIVIPMSALCFPWGTPLMLGWGLMLPVLFSMANLPLPDLASPLGRFCCFFPAILMAPLGYWVWFVLLPQVARSVWRALRIAEIKRAGTDLARRMRRDAAKWANRLREKTRKTAQFLKQHRPFQKKPR